MNIIERFLYSRQILKLNEKKLQKWHRKESIDKLIFAARNGIYSIRIMCIEFLNERINEPKVKNLLISMISDDVEIVAEAAIRALENDSTDEINKLIEQTRKNWKNKKKKKKRITYHKVNVEFGEKGKTRPSERLMNRLRDQQRTNEPPYGF